LHVVRPGVAARSHRDRNLDELATELSEARSQLWKFDSFASLANVTSKQARIPPDFWAELERQRLIEQIAPTPS
jgi:hypothetical protein